MDTGLSRGGRSKRGGHGSRRSLRGAMPLASVRTCQCHPSLCVVNDWVGSLARWIIEDPHPRLLPRAAGAVGRNAGVGARGRRSKGFGARGLVRLKAKVTGKPGGLPVPPVLHTRGWTDAARRRGFRSLKRALQEIQNGPHPCLLPRAAGAVGRNAGVGARGRRRMGFGAREGLG